MPNLSLTLKNIASIPTPEKRTEYWDNEVPGFLLRVGPSGPKVFYLVYRNRQGEKRRLKIGNLGILTPEKARDKAIILKGKIHDGIDPVAEKAKEIAEEAEAKRAKEEAKRRALTLDQFFETYMDHHAKVKKKKTSWVMDEYNWKKYLKPMMGNLALESISKADIIRMQTALKKHPVTANRCFALISTVLSFAEEWEARPIGSNPCRGIEKFAEESRKRYLTGPELARLFKSIDELEAKWHEPDPEGADKKQDRDDRISPEAAAAIRLLILTGCRRGEILTLRWLNVDLDDKCLRLPDSKTGAKIVYLNSMAVELLQRLKCTGEYVIPGRRHGKPMVNLSKPFKRVIDKAGISDLHIHDMRHSFASVAAGLNLGLPVIGKLLGHTQAQTTQRYAHLLDNPLRAATEAIGEEISKAMRGGVAEVVEVNTMEVEKHRNKPAIGG